jgi:hypothetical protein
VDFLSVKEVSTVSRGVRRTEVRLREDRCFRQDVENVLKNLARSSILCKPTLSDPPVPREDVSARMLRKLLPRMNDSPDWLMVSSDYMRLDNIGEVTDYRDVFES